MIYGEEGGCSLPETEGGGGGELSLSCFSVDAHESTHPPPFLRVGLRPLLLESPVSLSARAVEEEEEKRLSAVVVAVL